MNTIASGRRPFDRNRQNRTNVVFETYVAREVLRNNRLQFKLNRVGIQALCAVTRRDARWDAASESLLVIVLGQPIDFRLEAGDLSYR